MFWLAEERRGLVLQKVIPYDEMSWHLVPAAALNVRA